MAEAAGEQVSTLLLSDSRVAAETASEQSSSGPSLPEAAPLAARQPAAPQAAGASVAPPASRPSVSTPRVAAIPSTGEPDVLLVAAGLVSMIVSGFGLKRLGRNSS